MKRLFLILVACLLVALNLPAQKKYVISGIITNQSSGEVLIGATVYEPTLQLGTISNNYGFYSLTLPEGDYQITFSSLGLKRQVVTIKLRSAIQKNMELEEEDVKIEEVVVAASSPIKTNEFNMASLNIEGIRKLPNVIGEADLIKAIQLQSGVKTIGDGSSAMFIRGGSSDQNLILADEAPIYNPSHLFGLISVFNPDAINNVKVYKSNMPAQYGGRASAVIDAIMKEGNKKEFHFAAGVSPLAATLTAEGPVVKNNSSYLVSVRKSLINLFVSAGAKLPLVPDFYDVNIKANIKANDNNRFYISLYKGVDQLESVDGYYNNWGNETVTLRWNSQLSPKLFSNLTLVGSNYNNLLQFKDESKAYKWTTGLSDVNLKLDFSWYVNPNNVVKTGIASIYHQFVPGETGDSLLCIPHQKALESAIYILNDIKLTSRFGIDYGLRWTLFQNFGATTWYNYDQNYELASVNENEKGIYNSFSGLEPRISLNYKILSNSSFKLAYARNYQFLQVLQNNSLSYTSLETWFPANPTIMPLIADAYSVGWFCQLSEKYFLSVESYLKEYQNQIDYIDHARLINNPYIEGETRSGKATAYGFEFNLKKLSGKLTGDISYTFSRARRKIDGINDGKYYNSPYDIPHDFRITTGYQFNPKWSFGSTWNYASGRPVTLPIGVYVYQWRTVPLYSERNGSRMPDYHRLDLAATYTTKPNEKKSYWTINFGLFNAYGRRNPLGYEFKYRWDTKELEVHQYTMFRTMPNFAIKYCF